MNAVKPVMAPNGDDGWSWACPCGVTRGPDQSYSRAQRTFAEHLAEHDVVPTELGSVILARWGDETEAVRFILNGDGWRRGDDDRSVWAGELKDVVVVHRGWIPPEPSSLPAVVNLFKTIRAVANDVASYQSYGRLNPEAQSKLDTLKWVLGLMREAGLVGEDESNG